MHPLVRILGLISFAIVLQLVKWQILLIMGAGLAVLLIWRGAAIYVSMLRRSRWLMLSILLIYAFATPGEYVAALPDWVAPTHEGLTAGVTQMGRLAVMLAALSLLLATSRREEIMAGIYLLLQPLRLIGFEPARFSARLWLTLHYVETMPKGIFQRLRKQGWRLASILEDEIERSDTPVNVVMNFPDFRATDYAVLLILPIVLWWLS